MARKTRSSELETRTARARLLAGKYYWRGIRQGLAIGYRKVKGNMGGTWTVRLMVDYNRYRTKGLGVADDHQDADGASVLTYDQAQEKARAYAADAVTGKAQIENYPSIDTVADAIGAYLAWFAVNRRSGERTGAVCRAHILPALGDRPIQELTKRELEQWHHGLATTCARRRDGHARPFDPQNPEVRRKRKATANRVLTVLKAALNFALDDDGDIQRPWQRVKPFRGVDAPVVRFLSAEECHRLISACEPDFRALVQGALYTGARYGELVRMRVSDFNAESGTIFARHTKAGKPRHIYLTEEAQRFCAQVTTDRRGDEPLFARVDGSAWGASHQIRRLKVACAAAEIDPAVSFHILRHTYASALALKGVPLQVIAHALGHADTRICERHYAHLQPSYIADTIRANVPSYADAGTNVVSFKR